MGDMRGDMVGEVMDGAFSPEITTILLTYFMHKDKLDIDTAIKKIDDMERYIRLNLVR